MAQNNCQKIKLLKLYELLQQETDEQHPITTMALIDRLGQMGISCERRTVAKDMAMLNEQGYEVMTCQVGKEKGYYVEERGFSVPELKILIDAVQAASFITDKKTAELVDKIANLGGSHRAKIMKGNMVQFNTRKHSNEFIYYNIGYLEDAIQQQKKVSFRYFDLNERGEKVYRKDGEDYIVEPIALVFNEDNYYLMVYSSKYDNTANYRVDRMSTVEITNDPISEKALNLRENIGSYTEQAFKMYGGQPEEVTLRFDEKLIGVVYDKFGEGTTMVRLTEDSCVATVKVQISPTFWGWLFQFGKQMSITSPASLIAEYQHRVESLME
ncbi:putative DNA-binding transcriptional regulator YafY [Clostridiales Family XIII bacterium PM5-7]